MMRNIAKSAMRFFSHAVFFDATFVTKTMNKTMNKTFVGVFLFIFFFLIFLDTFIYLLEHDMGLAIN